MKLKFGVITFPGSNCDDDVAYVLEKILEQRVIRLWHKDTNLKGIDGVILPGGFTYGDYLRAGALAKYSPIMQSVIRFAQNGGFVLGICNGFQILCEAGLLPGTLLPNDNRKFVCKNVYIKADNKNSIITALVDTNTPLKIPIAHSQGRYYADGKTITIMRKNEQILFRYSDKYGNLSKKFNPNGSIENIAAICNKEKNVYGIMPHPERAADDELGNTDGLYIFNSIIHSLSRR